jgi:hypothetical protein
MSSPKPVLQRREKIAEYQITPYNYVTKALCHDGPSKISDTVAHSCNITQ